MLITLLRHGEVIGRPQVLRGRSDPALSAQGHEQLQRAWQTFTPDITHIVSSPLQRCSSFATQQAQQQQLPLTIIDTLQEIDFGDWEELTLDEARAHHPDCFARFQHDTWNWCAPNGEAYVEFRMRMRQALLQLQSIATRHLLVITHGGVIRALLAELLALSPSSAACIGVPLAGFCQLWLDDGYSNKPAGAPGASLLRLQWLEPTCG